MHDNPNGRRIEASNIGHEAAWFQFFQVDMGVKIFNPWTGKFLSEKSDGNFGCVDQEFSEATTFVGWA